ncbi:MAG: DMT family transporter [Desulfarculus sp.]|nr:DMT family transporter [Desulfarculus sp.]
MANPIPQPRSDRGGLLLVAAGAAMLSFSAVFVKLAHVGPTVAGFYRTLFGGLTLALILLFSGRGLRLGVGKWGLVLVSALFFLLDLTFWHRSIHYVGPGLATILSNLQVFFLAGIGAVFFRERLGWRMAMAVPLAMAGLYLLVGFNRANWPENYAWGLFLGFLTALAYASYILTLRHLQAGLEQSRVQANVVIISLLTALGMGPEAWLLGESFAIPDAQSWLALIGYGVCGQVLGWVLISRGLPRTPAARAGLILLMQPTLSFIWDMLFFARPTTPLELVGALGALAAIYLGATSRS